MRAANESAEQEVTLPAFCVDKYEFPGTPEILPERQIAFQQARDKCAAAGKRLCTEQEWEKACKGGARNRRFPYGHQYIENACATRTENGKDRGYALTGTWHGCKTAEDVFDLAGNLREWTSTPFSQGSSFMIVKGGDGYSPGRESRCAARASVAATAAEPRTGFRCCLTIGP
ncbi:MAG: formylglycine-generating enzyme family protein [Deltaproteobacteria bacterium]|nr:formylglycine-generating enzyme family protein [Deltaproteobacteria bacterium]